MPSDPSTSPVARLAPSPTGAQHLGNARTFLLAYWSARHHEALLRLRIEDIDSPRVKPWAQQQAVDDLRWLGIDWDGDPLVQTETPERYQAIVEDLLGRGYVYPCTCTRRDIESAASAPHEVQSERALLTQEPSSLLVPDGVVYPRTCSDWKPADGLPPESTYCFRLRTSDEEQRFEDWVCGPLAMSVSQALGDFPITRKGGSAAYQLAVVVDDIDAGVTEVVRGDDLVVSTFRQLELYRLLGASPPSYAHVPLVVGPDGRRLAKRHGDTRLSMYRDQGLPATEIVAWAAQTAGLVTRAEYDQAKKHWDLARWHREMINRFDWARLARRRVVVDQNFPSHGIER